MSKCITKKQQAVLDYIKSYADNHGFPPVLDEITAAFGWASHNAAFDHVKRLQEKGFVKITPGISRGITVIKKEQTPDREEMASALRVISTWASYDHERGERRALDPKHVLDLCQRVLRVEFA